MNWVNDWLHELVVGIVSALFISISTILRMVFTNQTKIDLLRQELIKRDNQRVEDRSVWQELRDDIKQVQRDILRVYQKQDQ